MTLSINIHEFFKALYESIQDLRSKGLHKEDIRVVANEYTWRLIQEGIYTDCRDVGIYGIMDAKSFTLFGAECKEVDYFPFKEVLVSFRGAGIIPDIYPFWINLEGLVQLKPGTYTNIKVVKKVP